MKMQRFHSDRETHGPEFDNRLIKLVRENPVIYDVNHPHYRRNPIRISIWERIAAELGAPSKFLQTKWKNIRYNYLQELKSLETGQVNVNIRKRRFTEDLSFLQNTAQTYNVKRKMSKNSSVNYSDNDSNSYVHSDSQTLNPCEVIEIENSEDSFQGDCGENSNAAEPGIYSNNKNSPESFEDFDRNESPPLLAPLISINEDNEQDREQDRNYKATENNHANTTNGEITIEPIPKHNKNNHTYSSADIIANASRRKSMPTPFPVLTPINDPIELYCLSLVDSLRNMPRSELERVKFEFAKILKDAKYKDES